MVSSMLGNSFRFGWIAELTLKSFITDFRAQSLFFRDDSIEPCRRKGNKVNKTLTCRRRTLPSPRNAGNFLNIIRVLHFMSSLLFPGRRKHFVGGRFPAEMTSIPSRAPVRENHPRHFAESSRVCVDTERDHAADGGECEFGKVKVLSEMPQGRAHCRARAKDRAGLPGWKWS